MDKKNGVHPVKRSRRINVLKGSKTQVRDFLECVELGKEMKVRIKEGLYFISRAWDCVASLIIESCLTEVNVLPNYEILGIIYLVHTQNSPKK